jgi:CTP:molybdopterin cytidylyltransferase MocA
LLAFNHFTRFNVVVAGKNADAIATVVGTCGAYLVRNPAPENGQFSSFLGALTAGFWAVAPEHDGKHGHPLLANRDLIDAFLKADITGNAREVLHAHASRVVYVPVPEPLTKAGLNTPEDYAAAE